ncbi:MAG: hypothetical protein LC620_05775 [Halobacteriales archaeon]|nr:hypothetical protein [Halobacteriales archaeon]
MTTEIETVEWRRLLTANQQWWRTPGSMAKDNPFSFYDRDDVIGENGYSLALLVALNRQLITTDSQAGRSEPVPSLAPSGFLRLTEEMDGLRRGSLDGLRCAEHQRPYLVAIAPMRLLDRFLETLSDVAIFIDGPRGCHSNSAFRAWAEDGGHRVNVTKYRFSGAGGETVHTAYPTNVRAQPHDWMRTCKGVPRAALAGLGMVAFIGKNMQMMVAPCSGRSCGQRPQFIWGDCVSDGLSTRSRPWNGDGMESALQPGPWPWQECDAEPFVPKSR